MRFRAQKNRIRITELEEVKVHWADDAIEVLKIHIEKLTKSPILYRKKKTDENSLTYKTYTI